MNSRIQILMAYCTFPDEETALRICEGLVRDGIVACANVFPPHKALYEWKGEIQSHPEVAAVLKLNARKRETLMERIRAVHPYETPALVFYDPAGCLPEFLKWVYSQSL